MWKFTLGTDDDAHGQVALLANERGQRSGKTGVATVRGKVLEIG